MGQITTYTGKVLDTCYFGTINLDTKIMVSDPCYSVGTWCQGVIGNVLPGEYHCHTYMSDEGIWGRRVAAITVCHSDYIDEEPDFCHEMFFEVGVDSGQAGIFDLAYYEQHHSSVDEARELNEEWYDRVCEATLSISQAGIVDEKCFVSSSGYGDGGYTCYTAEDLNGYVIGALIVYIDVDYEEDDEDDWEEEHA